MQHWWCLGTGTKFPASGKFQSQVVGVAEGSCADVAMRVTPITRKAIFELEPLDRGITQLDVIETKLYRHSAWYSLCHVLKLARVVGAASESRSHSNQA